LAQVVQNKPPRCPFLGALLLHLSMGCGATAGQKYGAEVKDGPPVKEEKPLPVLTDNQSRLVITTNKSERQYKCNPVFAEMMLKCEVGQMELPSSCQEMCQWRSSVWSLWEKKDGIEFVFSNARKSLKTKIASWTADPQCENGMEVYSLPRVQMDGASAGRRGSNSSAGNLSELGGAEGEEEELEGEHAEEVAVEVINIPELRNEDPTEIFPFMVKWFDGRAKSYVVGCEEEIARDKWVAQLQLYCNLSRRYCSAVIWKLGGSRFQRATTLPDDWYKQPDHWDVYRNLENWRRRIFQVEVLKHPNALCMTYLSEKLDAEAYVANVLATFSNGKAVAVVRKLPGCVPAYLTPPQMDKVRSSVSQYDVAVGRNWDRDVEVPKRLFGFEIRQADDCDGGHKHSLFAFDNERMCDRWLSAIEEACRQSKLPVVVERTAKPS